jgi:hypothetical protein
MNDPEDVKPLEKSGTVEVSQQAAPDAMPEAQDTNTATCTGYTGHPCANSIVKEKNRRRCSECAAEYAKSDEYRKDALRRAKRSRAKKKTKEEIQLGRYDSKEELPVKETPDVLAEAGVTTPCVLDAIRRFGHATAEILDLPKNEYYWLHGPDDLLARYAKSEPVSITDDFPEGELISRKELFLLFQFCARGRKILGKELSFQQWIEARLKAKTDLWFLCVDVCGKGLVEHTHREMVDFFVKKNPRLLNAGAYDQESLKAALLKQDSQHDRLLLFPRSFYKSTVNVLDLCQWLINFPDLRIAVQTSTLPLGKAFVSELKNYFVVRSLLKPTNFQSLFPECTMIGSEKGSETSFRNPAARLGLKEPSVFSTASEADSVGFHEDLLVDDDYVSPINSNTPEMRDKLFERYILAGETLDRPWGFRTTIGTRYAGGESPDIYGRLIELNEGSDQKDLKILVKGAWVVKPESQLKKIADLVEPDVLLLFPVNPDGTPGKGSFKELRRKLLSDERTFRQQQLNEAVDDDDEGKFKLNFDRDLLNKSVIHSAPAGETIISVDVAYTQNRYSDKTALSVIRLYTNEEGHKSMCVLWVESGRMRMSEVAQQAVLLTKRFSPKTVIIEKTPTYDLIQSEIERTSRKYQLSVPVFWAPVDLQKNAKFIRLKHVEVLLYQERLKFLSGEWVENLFNELERLVDNRKSSHGRTDDLADSISIAQRFFCPAIIGRGETDDTEEKKILENQIKEAHMKAQYERYFGGRSTFVLKPENQQVEPEKNPFLRLAGGILKRKS